MFKGAFYPRALAAALLIAVATGAAATGAAARAPPSLADLARSLLGTGQGVYVEAADGTVLVAQAAQRAVHPASVSKVPTTLALLRRLGPDFRFSTSFLAAGPLRADTLEGDLLVDGGGDPYFVDENALLVAQQLNQLGLRRVTGRLRARSPLTFDWQGDDAAPRLQRVLAGNFPPAAWEAVQALQPAASAPPALRFDGVEPAAAEPPRVLLVHRSQTLLELAKQLNDYSNNIFKPLADAAGGAIAVESVARMSVPAAMRAEIRLGDGAGTDARNRLSPRAAVKLLRALEQELARSGHRLVDILPVAGVDAGTLHDRLNAPDEAGRVVGKTGTFGDFGASALIGAIPTSDRGTVYFAILNHGVPVPVARQRQDRFVGALLARLHSLPWPYQPDARPAIARAQLGGVLPPPP
jgi:D-alanyl-D-alanine carboxypeptidase/D-alanyl-D-alanine-endopeptidase (penicillin-binding protein 4)